MDKRMRGSLITTKKLFNFYTLAFKDARQRNVVLISCSVRTFCKCSSRTRRQWKTVTNLLCQQGSAWRKDTIQPIGKTSFGSHHRRSEAQTLFPKSLCHYLDIFPIDEHHSVTVLTSFPLKNILHKPELSGRLTKWAVELSKHHIDYQPQMAIKSQVVIDFIADFSPNSLL